MTAQDTLVPPIAYWLAQREILRKKRYARTIREGFTVGEARAVVVERALKALLDLHFAMFFMLSLAHVIIAYLAHLIGEPAFSVTIIVLSATSVLPFFHFFAGAGYSHPVANNWFGQMGKRWEVFLRGVFVEILAIFTSVGFAIFTVTLSVDYAQDA